MPESNTLPHPARPVSTAPSRYRVDPLSRLTPPNAKWRTEAMRSHEQDSLMWITRGQGRITVAGVTRGYGAHNLIYLPAKTMYGYQSSGQMYGSQVFFPRDTDLTLPAEPLHMRFRDVAQQAEITGLIEHLNKEIETDAPARDRALDLQAGLISVWLERQMAIMPDYDMTPDASRRLAAAYTALVEQSFWEGHTVSDYAGQLGVTPTHLSRACNTACGRPASSLLADRVHFEARQMLLNTNKPVKDIARDLGFHSAAYFTRAFHKHTGNSPSAFRAKR